jgi:hypothetical protein
MSFEDIPLNELLKLASSERDGGKLLEFIHEINRRYAEQDAEITFEIFSGMPDRDAVWLESVSGLAAANDRMKQMAAATPGAYFVFHKPSRKIHASMDNSQKRADLSHEEPPQSNTV